MATAVVNRGACALDHGRGPANRTIVIIAVVRSAGVTLLWLALGALSVACGSHVEAPWAPELRHELNAYDYAVYSAWLARGSVAGTVLIDDLTLSVGHQGVAPLRQGPWVGVSEPAIPVPMARAPSTLPPDPSDSRDQAQKDLWLQQELSLPLERRLKGAVYDLVHDPVPADLLSSAKLILAFSRIGFDSRLEVARFSVLQMARGEWGWSAQLAGYAVWAERREGRWEVTEVQDVSPGSLVPVVGEPLVVICDSVTVTTTTTTPPCLGPVVIPIPLPLRPPK